MLLPAGGGRRVLEGRLMVISGKMKKNMQRKKQCLPPRRLNFRTKASALQHHGKFSVAIQFVRVCSGSVNEKLQ